MTGVALLVVLSSALAHLAPGTVDRRLDAEIGFESSGKTWPLVIRDLHRRTGLPIAAALRDPMGCSGYPATRATLKEILDSLSAAMGAKWSLQKGCVVFTPRPLGEALPTDLKSQAQTVGEFLGRLSPEHIKKLTTSSLNPAGLSSEAIRPLMRLAQSRSDGAGQVFAQALAKSDVYLRFTPMVDVLDEKGNVTSTIRLFSQVDYMVPANQSIDPDSSSTDAKLAELLMQKPAIVEVKPGEIDLTPGVEDKLSEVIKRVESATKEEFSYDRRLRDSKFLLIGSFPSDGFEDVLKTVCEVLPTEKKPKPDEWSMLSALAEGCLTNLADSAQALDYLDARVSDFLARKQMTVGELGPDALNNSQRLQAAGATKDTRIQLRPAVTLILDPHERRIVPEPAAINGVKVPMYLNYFMSWTVSD